MHKHAYDIIVLHPVARHLLFKSLIQQSHMQRSFIKLIEKFLHITLHVSTNTGHYQAFKVVDKNCCASVFIVSIFDMWCHLCVCVSHDDG
jgi:hypothetical protein